MEFMENTARAIDDRVHGGALFDCGQRGECNLQWRVAIVSGGSVMEDV